MAAAGAKNGGGRPKRKRARNIRTRIVDNDSSSSSSSSSSSEEEEDAKPESSSSSEDEETSQVKGQKPAVSRQKEDEMDIDTSTDSSSDSSSSSEEEEDSSDEDDNQAAQPKKASERRLFTPPPEPLTSWPESEQSGKYLPISLEQKYQRLIAQSDESVLAFTQNNSLMQEQHQRSEAIGRMEKNIEAQNARQGRSILGNNAASTASTDAILTPTSFAARREELERGWMKVMIEEYGNELDALRKKEPTLGTSNTDRRMPLLIDSLQSGAELFSDGINASSEDKRKAPKFHSIDETEIFLQGLKEE